MVLRWDHNTFESAIAGTKDERNTSYRGKSIKVQQYEKE